MPYPSNDVGEGAHKLSKPGKRLENYAFASLVYKIKQVDELEVIVKSMVGFGHVNHLKPNWIPIVLLPLGHPQTSAPSVLSVNMIVHARGKFGLVSTSLELALAESEINE